VGVCPNAPIPHTPYPHTPTLVLEENVIRVCFVCMGNICRSPLAEGVFKHLAAEAGAGKDFQIESFGIGAWHVGEDPDSRSQDVARAHGIRLTSRAQQFQPEDFPRFDHVLALDETIASDLHRLATRDADRAKIRLLRAYDPWAEGNLNVPDPYYGDQQGFEVIYQMIYRACRKLLKNLSTEGAN